MFAIGIDVGGTQTRAAAVDHSGHVHAIRRTVTPGDGDQLIEWLAGSIRELRGEVGGACGEFGGVGLALPGIIDRRGQFVTRSVNLSYLENRPVVDQLRRSTGLTAILATDAEAATWGEYRARAEPGPRFAHLRLGSGIACGVVIDGELRELDSDRDRHLDILVVDDGPDAMPCRCGGSGCLETLASGPALAARARRLGIASDLDGLQRAWEQGDEAAQTLINETARAVSAAIGNLAASFEVEVVTLGGGVTAAIGTLTEQISSAVQSRAKSCGTDHMISVGRSALGDQAGVIGAALIAMKQSPNPVD